MALTPANRMYSYTGIQSIRFNSNGGDDQVSTAAGLLPTKVATSSITDLSPYTADWGDYAISVSSTGVTDSNGATGAIGSVETSWSMGERAPFVRIVRGVTPSAVINYAADHLTVEFSVPVDAASFTAADLSLTRDGGPNLLLNASGVSVVRLSDTRLRVDGLASLTSPSGDYIFSVFVIGIATPGGTAGVGRYVLAWVNDKSAPLAATDVQFTPDLGVSSTDRLTNSTLGTVIGSLTDTDAQVTLYDSTNNRDLGRAVVSGNTFSASVDLIVPGTHQIRVRVTDVAGNSNTSPFAVAWGVSAIQPQDTIKPNSLVETLSVESDPSFTVRWSGTDDASGVASFDVYVSVNSGPYSKWQSGTTLTTSVFNGEIGRNYAFYSIASDSAGNVEAAPSVADAFNTVVGATIRLRAVSDLRLCLVDQEMI